MWSPSVLIAQPCHHRGDQEKSASTRLNLELDTDGGLLAEIWWRTWAASVILSFWFAYHNRTLGGKYHRRAGIQGFASDHGRMASTSRTCTPVRRGRMNGSSETRCNP